ncbi:hypothetical protein YC2023_056581 [Brassica napus]
MQGKEKIKMDSDFYQKSEKVRREKLLVLIREQNERQREMKRQLGFESLSVLRKERGYDKLISFCYINKHTVLRHYMYPCMRIKILNKRLLGSTIEGKPSKNRRMPLKRGEHTVFFSKRRKNSSLCAHHMAE